MKIDTVDWYLKLQRDIKEKKQDVQLHYKARLNCCNNLIKEGHHKECVYYQPEGDTHINRIVQHYPAYFSGFDVTCVGFDTVEELLEIPFVKGFNRSVDGHQFYRYSIGDDHLMAEYNEGKVWWCIGRVRDGKQVNLPKWEPVYEHTDKSRSL